MRCCDNSADDFWPCTDCGIRMTDNSTHSARVPRLQRYSIATTFHSVGNTGVTICAANSATSKDAMVLCSRASQSDYYYYVLLLWLWLLLQLLLPRLLFLILIKWPIFHSYSRQVPQVIFTELLKQKFLPVSCPTHLFYFIVCKKYIQYHNFEHH